MRFATDLISHWAQIKEKFSYSEDDREVFEYLKVYSKCIDNELNRVASDEASIHRYMLAGLFLAYRASNHTGSEMTTYQNSEGQFFGQLTAYHGFTGLHIIDMTDYLKRIRFVKLYVWAFLLGSMGKSLCRYVVRG
jgi:hypothetical protein